MFPSASNLSSGGNVPLASTDWLYNQSFQVPVATLPGEEDKESESSGDEIKLVEEIVTIKDKKKKKKKRSRGSSRSRSRSKSPERRRHRKDRDKSPSYSRSRDKKKSHKKKSRRSESPQSEDERKKSDSFGNKVFLEEVGLPPEKAFRQDFQPDRNNLAFNCIYNLLVPSYDKKKCFKTKSLLELSRKGKQSTTERYFDLRKDAQMSSDENQPFLSVTKGETLNLPEIIPVTGSAFKVVNEPRQIGDSLKDFYDSTTSSYIKAKDPSRDLAEKEAESSTLTNDEEKTQRRNREFNEHLRSKPNDIETWFKFLQWQEDSFIWSASTTCTKSRETVLAEKKLSIVEKALESNPKCIRLVMERLDIMRFTSTPSELDKEWKRLVFIYPNNPLIWRNYFLFLQTHLKYFSVEKITRAFHKCFDIYSSMLEGTFETHQITPNLEIEILKSVFHFTSCLSHSGYREKAIAIWQILIEFNLFTPEILDFQQSIFQWKILLEPFWDSGCSRFGEVGALGWDTVMRTKSLNQGPSQAPIDDLEEPLFDQFGDNRAALWVKLELLRERYYWLPVKGPQADQADDTERNISIDALTRVLFRFRLDQTKYQLIVFFLKFLDAIDSSDLLDDHFLTDDCSTLAPMKSLFSLRPMAIYHDFTSFQDQVFTQAIEKFKSQSKQEKELITWRLKFLIKQVGDTIKYKEVKKIIKDYLKLDAYRNDLDIWLLLTQLETKKGDDTKDAEKIFDTAINLFTGRIDNSRYLLSFARHYCELLLAIPRDLYLSDLSYIGSDLAESEVKVIKIITSVIVGQTIETINSPAILKGQTVLNTMINQEDDYYLEILFSHLLLKLINDNSNQPFDYCDNLLAEGIDNRDNLRGLFTIYLQLLIFDARRKIKSISRLRNVNRLALESFPDHKPFLSLFTTIETNIALPITINRFFTNLLRATNSSSLTIWIFKLHFELKRLTIIKDCNEGSSQSFDGIIRRINSLFERCLSFPCNQGIILLWRCYLKFNITWGDLAKAESLVYRALQHCPWSKVIYLDAIDTFPHLLTDLVTMMADKEIRLRAPLEEIDLLLQAQGIPKVSDEDEDGDGDGDGQEESTSCPLQSIGDFDDDDKSEDSVKDEEKTMKKVNC